MVAGVKTFPAFSAHAQPAILCLWQEANSHQLQAIVLEATAHASETDLIKIKNAPATSSYLVVNWRIPVFRFDERYMMQIGIPWETSCLMRRKEWKMSEKETETRLRQIPVIRINMIITTVETLYSTIYYSKYFIELNNDKSTQYVALWTHKRHPIPRPFGRAMECLLWVLQQKLTVL